MLVLKKKRWGRIKRDLVSILKPYCDERQIQAADPRQSEKAKMYRPVYDKAHADWSITNSRVSRPFLINMRWRLCHVQKDTWLVVTVDVKCRVVFLRFLS